MSKTLGKVRGNVTLSSDPESLQILGLGAPPGSENDILCLTSVQWPADLGMGVVVAVSIMIICVENVYGFYGLKITD